MSAGLKNAYVSWNEDISPREWEQLFALAERHRILPLLYQAVHRCPALEQCPTELLRVSRHQVFLLAARQVRQTQDLMEVAEALTAAEIRFLVVKGIICRRLYPNPDFRLSGDEDLLIHPGDFRRCRDCLRELGYSTPAPDSTASDLPYHNSGRSLHLEIHRELFPGGESAYGELNAFFREVFTESVIFDGIPTMAPTDHLLYLLLHAFKHFLHSGFGIRQVCDIMLYANMYGEEIRWTYLLQCCREIRAERFAAALFRIGWKHLGFSPEQSCCPSQWQAIHADEEPLLQDILDAGVYGNAQKDRLHSSNVTLQAVSAQKQGKDGAPLLRSLFPGRDAMAARYPYVHKSAALLPVAWCSRLVKFMKSPVKASDAVRIGYARLALLEKYGILDKNS